MHHLQAVCRGPLAKVPFLDQRGAQPAQRGFARHGGAARTASNDEHVEGPTCEVAQPRPHGRALPRHASHRHSASSTSSVFLAVAFPCHRCGSCTPQQAKAVSQRRIVQQIADSLRDGIDTFRVDEDRRVASQLQRAVAVRRQDRAASGHGLDDGQRTRLVQRRHQQARGHRVQRRQVLGGQPTDVPDPVLEAEAFAEFDLVRCEEPLRAARHDQVDSAGGSGRRKGLQQAREVLRRIQRTDEDHEAIRKRESRSERALCLLGHRLAEPFVRAGIDDVQLVRSHVQVLQGVVPHRRRHGDDGIRFLHVSRHQHAMTDAIRQPRGPRHDEPVETVADPRRPATHGQGNRVFWVEQDVEPLTTDSHGQRHLVPEQPRPCTHHDVPNASALGEESGGRVLLEEQHELMPRPEAEHLAQQFVRVDDDATGVLPDVSQHESYAHSTMPGMRRPRFSWRVSAPSCRTTGTRFAVPPPAPSRR